MNNRLTKADGSTLSATVPTTNNKISAVGSDSYSYDAAGNITDDGTRVYVWDDAGRLKEVEISSTTVGAYTYNASNQRAIKVASSVTTHYIYGAGGLLYGEYDSAGDMIREYIYLNSEPLTQINDGSPETPTYLHTDNLGTPRYGTSAAGSQVWAWDSDAFGNAAPSSSVTVNLRMAGQYHDAETGLFYNWNRYYNPQIGRYVSSDPIGLEGGINTFNYVEQNPLLYTDPTGEVVPVITGGAFLAALFSTNPANAPDINGEVLASDPARPIKNGLAVGLTAGSICRLVGVAKIANKDLHFGRNQNQVEHAFRHTDKLGLSRSDIRTAIQRDISKNATNVGAGSNTRTIVVNGVRLTYNAHRLPNGSINVGRITGP